EAALFRQCNAGLVLLRTLSRPRVDKFADALQLHRVNDGAHVDGLIQRIADAKLFHARSQLRDEAIMDAFLHQKPRTGTADLALVEPYGIYDAFDCRIEIGIFEDHEGRLAA